MKKIHIPHKTLIRVHLKNGRVVKFRCTNCSWNANAEGNLNKYSITGMGWFGRKPGWINLNEITAVQQGRKWWVW